MHEESPAIYLRRLVIAEGGRKKFADFCSFPSLPLNCRLIFPFFVHTTQHGASLKTVSPDKKCATQVRFIGGAWKMFGIICISALKAENILSSHTHTHKHLHTTFARESARNRNSFTYGHQERIYQFRKSIYRDIFPLLFLCHCRLACDFRALAEKRVRNWLRWLYLYFRLDSIDCQRFIWKNLGSVRDEFLIDGQKVELFIQLIF